MNLKERLNIIAVLGDELSDYLENPTEPEYTWVREAVANAFQHNGWFEEREVHRALRYWSNALSKDSLRKWLGDDRAEGATRQKTIALIMAGNIPLVGFHDLLTVFISGHRALIKCSSDDNILIPALVQRMIQINPACESFFSWSEPGMKGYDAIIATGSSNSARHFKHYFSHVPHIIRRNRTGIAILQGNESKPELQELMKDVLYYYGLGCRNVTKVFLPKGYDLNQLFEASLSFEYVLQNKKYGNNLNYQRTLLAMQQKPFLENGLFLLCESESLFSPVSILHAEYYNDPRVLDALVLRHLDDIQCVLDGNNRAFGSAQSPALNDYADGVNTLEFAYSL